MTVQLDTQGAGLARFIRCAACHMMRPTDYLVLLHIGGGYGPELACVSPVVCRLSAQGSGLWGATEPRPVSGWTVSPGPA
jgi:hypothetical protein